MGGGSLSLHNYCLEYIQRRDNANNKKNIFEMDGGMGTCAFCGDCSVRRACVAYR